MRYAVFAFSTPNLGDDVQSLAAALLLPRVDAYVDRDQLDRVSLAEPHQLIMNSWFAVKRYEAVPKESLVPHYFGQCVGRRELLNEKWLAEWRRRGPIGCRDTASLAMLQEHGIEAYYSGCLTTWMGRFIDRPRRRDGVILLDVPERMEAFVPDSLRRRARRLSNETAKGGNPWDRFRRAAEILDIVRGAELVVTRRLHAALPCVGFNTPVTVYLEDNGQNRHRFSGADQFLPMIFHDGERPIGGQSWIEPQAVKAPATLEARFQALAQALGARVEPRWRSVAELADQLPDLAREPRGMLDRLRGAVTWEPVREAETAS